MSCFIKIRWILTTTSLKSLISFGLFVSSSKCIALGYCDVGLESVSSLFGGVTEVVAEHVVFH